VRLLAAGAPVWDTDGGRGNVEEVFRIVPASAKAVWFLWAITAILVAPALLLGYAAITGGAVEYHVSPLGLRMRGDFYGRTVPLTSLQPAQARRVDLQLERDFQPKWKTNGIALPGYRSGWFRRRDGAEASLFGTDPSKLVCLPTRDGYSLLLRVAQPDSFLQSLTRVAN